MPPSPEVLEARLRGRSRDDAAAITRRLAIARCEVESYEHYDYVVVNDDLEQCVRTLEAIVLAERARLDATRGVARAIVDRFAATGVASEHASAGRTVECGKQGA